MVLSKWELSVLAQQLWCKSKTILSWASQMVPVVKNPPANAGDERDAGSIPGLGRSPGRRNRSNILAWEIPWTEEPGGLQSMGAAKSQT